MTPLHVIQAEIGARSEAIATAHPQWPCRKGCDDCCRRLASVPVVTGAEWQLIDGAIRAMPGETAEGVRQRIRESAGSVRPVVCPLLDTSAGTCLVYEARPVACRSYGFSAEREGVLGCGRIETLAEQLPDVVWGNQAAIEDRLRLLGPGRSLAEWLYLSSPAVSDFSSIETVGLGRK